MGSEKQRHAAGCGRCGRNPSGAQSGSRRLPLSWRRPRIAHSDCFGVRRDRNLFEIRLVTPQAQAGTVIVRAPRNVLDAATRLLEGFGNSRPQVMLDVHVYEITNSLTRNMGLHIPSTFQLLNIPVGALAALG